MPTKPLTQPEAWATNALYTTGPFIGSASKVVPAAGIAAEGHRPGSLFPTAAEHENSQQNRITALARWLFLGTSNPDVDAHVVETDTGGFANLHGLGILNLLDQTAVNIVSSALNFPAVLATVATGGTIFQADPGNSGGICYQAFTKAGSAMGFSASMANSPSGARGFFADLVNVASGAFGFRGNADATTAATLLRLDHSGTGQAIAVQHFGTPGALTAMSVSCFGGGNTRAMDISGSGVIESIRMRDSGSPGSSGGFADVSNTSGVGLRARTAAGALAASRAVRAEARGSATGVDATADAGDAVRIQSTGNAGTGLFHAGRNTDSTTTFNGHIDFNTTTGTWTHSDQDAGNWRDFWSSRGGIAIGNSSDGQTVTNNNSAVYTLASTLNLVGQDAPHRAGVRIILRFTCDARSTVATTNTIDLRITDTTEAPDVVVAERSGVGVAGTDGYFLAVATTSWQRSIVLDIEYVIPAAGARTFIAEVKTATANGIQIRDPKLVPFGCMP